MLKNNHIFAVEIIFGFDNDLDFKLLILDKIKKKHSNSN